jgi:SAM-dependent methyltransferase
VEHLIDAKQLDAELDEIMSHLAGHIKTIGVELDKPFETDAAKVRTAISNITMLSHKFMQFLPKVGAARNATVRAKGELSATELHAWSGLSTRLYRERTWLIQWSRIEELVRIQIPVRRQKLYVKQARADDIMTNQLSVCDGVFEELHKILNPTAQTEAARIHGCFSDIPLPHSAFLSHVHAAHRTLLAQRLGRPTRFLDVGCGGGLKVLSASKFFDRADGLEFDPSYVTAAQNLFDRSSVGTCRVIQGDGLIYQDYDKYDVIYFYRPMRDNDLLDQLEHQIINVARPGTLIIAPYPTFAARHKTLGCGHVGGQLYITQTSQAQADELRRRAEMTGPFVRNNAPRAASLWDPILNASQAMGFGLLQ